MTLVTWLAWLTGWNDVLLVLVVALQVHTIRLQRQAQAYARQAQASSEELRARVDDLLAREAERRLPMAPWRQAELDGRPPPQY